MRDDCNKIFEPGGVAYPAEQLFGDRWHKDLAVLLAESREQKYECESKVIAASDPPDKVFFLKKGGVEMIGASGSVNSIKASQAGSPMVFGLLEALSWTGSANDLRAATPCVFDVIKTDDLTRFLHERPELCFRLTRKISDLCRNSAKRFACSGLRK
jgi:CRP-like cAMP-binding protein